MNTHTGEVYTHDEVSGIIRRALQLEGAPKEVSLAELEEIAAQSGVSSVTLSEAIVLEREARDLEEAKRLVELEMPGKWRKFALVECLVLAGMLALMAMGEVGPAVLIGWAIGMLIGVPLVLTAIKDRQRKIFRRLQERRSARESAMLTMRKAEATHKLAEGTH